MSARVPPRPTGGAWTAFVSGRAPTSGTWVPLARLANWINGRGGQLLACMNVADGIAQGGSATYNVGYWPRYQATERVWLVRMHSDNAASIPTSIVINGVTFEVVIPASVALGSGSFDTSLSPTFAFHEEVSSRGTAREVPQITVNNNSGAAGLKPKIFMESISLVEVPRLSLQAGVNEDSVEVDDFQSRSPIYNDTERGMWIAEAAKRGINICRRNTLFNWTADTANPKADTSGSYVNAFDLDPLALGRVMYNGETTRLIRWAVYAEALSSTGSVRLTTSKGSSTISVPVTGAYAWSTDHTVDLDVEDLDDDQGLPSGAWTSMAFELQAGSAGHTVRIAAIAVGEDAIPIT